MGIVHCNKKLNNCNKQTVKCYNAMQCWIFFTFGKKAQRCNAVKRDYNQNHILLFVCFCTSCILTCFLYLVQRGCSSVGSFVSILQVIALPCLAIGIISPFFLSFRSKKISKIKTKKLLCPAWQLASSVLFFFFSVKKNISKIKIKKLLCPAWQLASSVLFFFFFGQKKHIKNQNQKIALPCLAIGIISHFFLFFGQKKTYQKSK